MANYYTNDIIFSSDDITALQDLHMHIMNAVRISSSFGFKPSWVHTRWTKYYTVAMAYGVQSIYEIGRCTITDVSDINYNWFSIKSDTAWTPMIVFWVDIINMFYGGRINVQWRSWYEDNQVVTNQEDEETHYCMDVHSEGQDNVLHLDRLFNTSNAPFVIPNEPKENGNGLYVSEMNNGLFIGFEDYVADYTESQCIDYLRSLSSKYDSMQSLFQLITDPDYTFDGDINIVQNNYRSTEDIIEEDLNICAAYYADDEESFEGCDIDGDRLYKIYDSPTLFVRQPNPKPIINQTIYSGPIRVNVQCYPNPVQLPDEDCKYEEGSII